MDNKCKICIHKRICRHYKYFQDNFLDIYNMDCGDFTKELDVKSESINATSTLDRYIPNVNYPDLNQIDIPHEEFAVTPVEIQKVQCERCKKEVPSTEIENCSVCKRAVCNDCSMTEMTVDGQLVTTCESCWSNTPDPDPNAEEEVVISYGEEKSSWDIDDFSDNKKAEEVEDKKEGAEENEKVGIKRPTKKSKKQ